jgi:hypothetical protein
VLIGGEEEERVMVQYGFCKGRSPLLTLGPLGVNTL